MKIRLLYRSPLAPPDIALGQSGDVPDELAAHLLAAGDAELTEPQPAEPEPPTKLKRA